MQPTFTTIQEARKWASVFLQQYNRESRVADLLLEYHLDLSFSQLLAYERDSFPSKQKDPFIKDVKEHARTGVPVQHIIGHAHFYGREFKVNQNVLVPRPETEELVLGVLKWLSQTSISRPSIVDIGTGSGVIAITLALELENAEVTATDLSADALEVAAENARTHKASVEWREGSFLEPVSSSMDVLVSNPPYISYDDKKEMADTVVDFDPEMALFAENEGMAAYEAIIGQVKRKQFKPKLIAFEIGHQQGIQVKELIERHLPGYQVEIRKDINQKDRMIFAERQV
ncbi:peptide chain release factor N(5)-glutamine methyltransferase [Halobacillus yeomjeoni]|uniref:peptide chain release factor N(5)-glutamine methyltransferase n=1 Tax=Halobacillus yeomjeoni TaxID=311194 RepID=UPI001CD78209|nr:peptide chain release factor N(5)-glutamine methyltransferase [Halobacillus yeomjeoni]MCA0985463.1 peptide chain release factor N(5)-glutamine methyltransferase [Halobacillus yeomjeoni]